MISIVILAAGLSTRFGRNKLLELVGGRTLIERVVSNSIGSKADEVIVVLGHEAEEVQKVLRALKCRLVFNENYLQGQSYSVKAGLGGLKPEVEAVVVLPGDVVGILTEHMDLVIDEYRRSRAQIVVASHKGKMGHPILFDRSLFKEMAEIDEKSEGLKKIITRHRQDIRMVEASTERVLVDIDKIDDLESHRYFFSY